MLSKRLIPEHRENLSSPPSGLASSPGARDDRGSYASREPPEGGICVLSRQRIVGNTNGSSTYLLSLCEALHRDGHTLHLLCPSPTVFGRWPVLVMGRIWRSSGRSKSAAPCGSGISISPLTPRCCGGLCWNSRQGPGAARHPRYGFIEAGTLFGRGALGASRSGLCRKACAATS